MSAPISDPTPGGERDLRPIVVSRRRDPGPLTFGLVVLVGAGLLFMALDGRRRAASAPTAWAPSVDSVAVASPPPLDLPSEAFPPPPPPYPIDVPVESEPFVPAPSMPAPPAPAEEPPGPSPSVAPSPRDLAEPHRQSGRLLVFDRPFPGGAAGAPAFAPEPDDPAVSLEAGGGSPPERARVVRLRQLAATVPQGTLIPAVLETALDSTRPGFVRALVTRDVRGFDGTRVLIPRGSRLFGEYEADLGPGQSRAFVRWTRLVRPDGSAIAIDSPAADALGRAGVAGRVNSHFLQRFGGAILNSTVNLGVGMASRNIADGAVIVALPGAAATEGVGAAPLAQPTLSVDAGTTVTVFVARDLHLPTGEPGPQA